MVPPTVPGFRFLRPLGGGPLFEVWEVRPADDVTPFALKCPRPEVADSPTAVTLLRREARAGRLVRNPRLLRVVRARIAEPPHYVLSELIPGESMDERLARAGGRLLVRNAVWIARQTAEAVAALHAAGLTHGDVKPANVRLAPNGEATLVDLAFASRPGENRLLYAKGYVPGTANYLAPESCGSPPVGGPAADVFALGVMLFQALTGELPYPAGSADAAIDARRTGRPRSVDGYATRWPDGLPDVVAGALDTDPGRRPSAKGVVRALARIEMNVLRRVTVA